MIGAGTRLGPYEVVAPLGAGGMGEVYRARDTRLGREVAVKVLPAEVCADLERLSRFEQEARSASALNHPNIVTVYDVGRSDSASWIAMELIQGKTLRELVAAGPLPMRRALSIAAQVADGLAKAHAAGIVHRDLKPENLMVSSDGFVKILDFGLAKLVPESSGAVSEMVTTAGSQTQSGVVVGTVGYMSPEQAGGRPLDFRSDQFSFGSILYEMAAGKRAFSGQGAGETLAAILRDDPQPLTELNPSVPAPLGWIVERCLAKDPEERYASTRDLARELVTLRDHLSEASKAATGAVTRPRRPWKRLTAAIGIAAAVALAFLLGRGVSPRASSPNPLHRLTYRRGTIWSARFAPGGDRVIYGAAWDGQPVELYETRVGGAESRPLSLGHANVLAISPAGEMAILLDPRRIYTYRESGTLARVPMTGGAPREVVTDARTADWGPDGTELAVSRSVGGKDRLEYPVGKTLYESSGVIGSFRFSPRGDWIALYEYSEGARVLGIRVSDRQVKVLSDGWRVWSVGLAWSSSGEEVWFTASRDKVEDSLYAADLTGRVRLIARLPGTLQIFDVDGKGRVLMSQALNRVGIALRTAGSDQDRDVSWFNSSFLGDLSPDGSLVVFHELVGAADAIYLRRTDGSPAAQLGVGYALNPITLSPDATRVVASVLGKTIRLEVLPLRAGEKHALPSGPVAGIGSLRWLPDGRKIVFSGWDARGTRMYVQDVSGGPPRAFGPGSIRSVKGSGGDVAVSPDGAVVAVVGRDGAIVICAVGGDRPPRSVAGQFSDDELIGWSDDGRFLYSYRIGELPGKIYRIEIATGNREVWRQLIPADPAGSWRIHPVRISPDGRSHAYSYSHILSDLYVFEGLR